MTPYSAFKQGLLGNIQNSTVVAAIVGVVMTLVMLAVLRRLERHLLFWGIVLAMGVALAGAGSKYAGLW